MIFESKSEPLLHQECTADLWAVKKQRIEIIPLPALMDMTPPEVRNLVEKIHIQDDVATTYMQMYYVFMLSLQYDAASDMQSRALQLRRIFRIQSKSKPKLRLLVVMGPGNMLDNTAIEFVLHGCEIQTSILYLLPDDDALGELPEHDVTFVAIGESSKNLTLLEKLNNIMRDWPTPVVNRPGLIKNCARDTCYQLLKNIPGVYMPTTLKIGQKKLLKPDFPITIRPIDTQGGEGLERIDDAAALARYFAKSPAHEYYLSKFLNYQSPDGYYRKMRVVLIDGIPYICHLAISDDWIVHYHSAGMAEDVEKRNEEQQVMEEFDSTFSVRFSQQLRQVAHAMQLDYVTVDCTVGPAGDLVIFEVDSRGIIHAADPVHIYPYKPAVMQKAFDAFQSLMLKRSRVE